MTKALKGKRVHGPRRGRWRERWLATAASCVLVTAFLAGGVEVGAVPSPMGGGGRQSESDGGATVARLAVGAGPEMVGIESPEDGDEWGPSAFDVGPDGRFYVLDGVNERIHVLGANGSYEREIEFPDGVLCPVDIRVTTRGLYLLDLPLQPAAVHLVDWEGRLISSWEIPEAYVEDCVTGLRVAESSGTGGHPSIWLRIQRAWEVPLLIEGGRTSVDRVPMRRVDDVVDVPDANRKTYATGNSRTTQRFAIEKDWESWQSVSLTSYRGGVPGSWMHVTSNARIGAAWYLDSDAEGRSYVFAEEICASSTSAYVKVFDRDGRPLGVCRIPLERCRTFPQQDLRVTETGDVLALVPGCDEVEIVRLDVQERRTDDLSGADAEASVVDGDPSGRTVSLGDRLTDMLAALFVPEQAHAIWNQLDAYDRAMEYCNNSWYCNKYNYYPNGVNIRPRYITSYNRYWQSVPYCWGGWDLTSTFNDAMSSNMDAGDINTATSGKQPSTAGTDCSGLVSRLWGLGHKRNTSTTAYWGLGATDVSYYIGLPGKAGERLGDIYLKPGSHVMMVDYVTLGGARVFESTTWLSYDRVVHPIRAWSGIPGYYARRYINWWQ